MSNFSNLRHEMGLTSIQISKIYGIPYNTVQNWEHGYTSPPDYVLRMIRDVWKYKYKKSFDSSKL